MALKHISLIILCLFAFRGYCSAQDQSKKQDNPEQLVQELDVWLHRHKRAGDNLGKMRAKEIVNNISSDVLREYKKSMERIDATISEYGSNSDESWRVIEEELFKENKWTNFSFPSYKEKKKYEDRMSRIMYGAWKKKDEIIKEINKIYDTHRKLGKNELVQDMVNYNLLRNDQEYEGYKLSNATHYDGEKYVYDKTVAENIDSLRKQAQESENAVSAIENALNGCDRCKEVDKEIKKDQLFRNQKLNIH